MNEKSWDELIIVVENKERYLANFVADFIKMRNFIKDIATYWECDPIKAEELLIGMGELK